MCRTVLLPLACALVFSLPAPAETVEAASVQPSPREVLERAFENRYEVDTAATIELVMRDRRGSERSRHFESASKLIEDRMHAIGRLVRPEYLRGFTILQIEADDRGHDAFVYMPSLKNVRRVTTSQRGDAFFGTDVTYEDLERRHVEDYEVTGSAEDTLAGEPVWRIDVVPLRDSTYDSAQFTIAHSDYTILASRYFRRGQTEPYRLLTVSRTGMVEGEGHVLPTRMKVENLRKGTSTEVTFKDLRINPTIDDRIFSIRTLEQQKDLSRSIE